MKKISQNDIVGEQGVNFIQRVVLDMGFLWYPTGLEAGIDGYVELRAETGEVTNCIIQVQSKATDRTFEGETDTELEYRCSQRDLDYWLGGNAPVILVRSRPRTGEAYWVSLKGYFASPITRKTGKVIFQKSRDRFDLNARAALQRLATPADSGLYLGARPKVEVVYSNLLKLAPLPEHYYVASTDYRTRGELFAALRELTRDVRGEWLLGGRLLTSFHDLSRSPWNTLCDQGTIEKHDTKEWTQTTDLIRQRALVQLLNACLREKLFPQGIKYSRDNDFYYFRATRDLTDREYGYQSRENRTSRWVFKGYPKKSDHTQMSYYRHSAFSGHFVRYATDWYLQITPNYLFTRDGERPSFYASALLSGIKRLENNQAVHGQVVMWAQVLTERSLFDTGPTFLDFSNLMQFELLAGLDDTVWLKHEDKERQAHLQAPAVDERQASLFS